MSDVPRKVPMVPTRAAFIHAIQENGAEFLLAMGRASGAEEHHTPAIHWVIGGSPVDYHNCVVRANLAADAVDDAIVESIQRFGRLVGRGTGTAGRRRRRPPPALRWVSPWLSSA